MTFSPARNMSTSGSPCVLNDKLFCFAQTYNGNAFPVYNLVTSEVKYCHP